MAGSSLGEEDRRPCSNDCWRRQAHGDRPTAVFAAAGHGVPSRMARTMAPISSTSSYTSPLFLAIGTSIDLVAAGRLQGERRLERAVHGAAPAGPQGTLGAGELGRLMMLPAGQRLRDHGVAPRGKVTKAPKSCRAVRDDRAACRWPPRKPSADRRPRRNTSGPGRRSGSALPAPSCRRGRCRTANRPSPADKAAATVRSAARSSGSAETRRRGSAPSPCPTADDSRSSWPDGQQALRAAGLVSIELACNQGEPRAIGFSNSRCRPDSTRRRTRLRNADRTGQHDVNRVERLAEQLAQIGMHRERARMVGLEAPLAARLRSGANRHQLGVGHFADRPRMIATHAP